MSKDDGWHLYEEEGGGYRAQGPIRDLEEEASADLRRVRDQGRSVDIAREALRVAQVELQGLRDFKQRVTTVAASHAQRDFPGVLFTQDGKQYVPLEAYQEHSRGTQIAYGAIEALKAEIKAAVLTEREACARICDGIKEANYGRDQAWGVAEAIAKKIRERA